MQKQFDKANSLGRDSLNHPATVCKSRCQVTPFVLDGIPICRKLVKSLGIICIFYTPPLSCKRFFRIVVSFPRSEGRKTLKNYWRLLSSDRELVLIFTKELSHLAVSNAIVNVTYVVIILRNLVPSLVSLPAKHIKLRSHYHVNLKRHLFSFV